MEIIDELISIRGKLEDITDCIKLSDAASDAVELLEESRLALGQAITELKGLA